MAYAGLKNKCDLYKSADLFHNWCTSLSSSIIWRELWPHFLCLVTEKKSLACCKCNYLFSSSFRLQLLFLSSPLPCFFDRRFRLIFKKKLACNKTWNSISIKKDNHWCRSDVGKCFCCCGSRRVTFSTVVTCKSE